MPSPSKTTLIQHISRAATAAFATSLLAGAWLGISNFLVARLSVAGESWGAGESVFALSVQLFLFGLMGLFVGCVLSLGDGVVTALATRRAGGEVPGSRLFRGADLLRTLAFGGGEPHWGATLSVLVAMGLGLGVSQLGFRSLVFFRTDRPDELAVLLGSTLWVVLVLLVHRLWAHFGARAHAMVVVLALCAYLFFLLPTAFAPIGYDQKMFGVAWLAAVMAFALAEPHWRVYALARPRGAGLVAALVLVVLGAGWSGAVYEDNPSVHAALVADDAGLHRTSLAWVRSLGDLDGDGYARIAFGGDCDDANFDVHPGQLEIPGNGVDDNCRGGDLPVEAAVVGARRFAPVHFREPGKARPNVLFVSVDTLRADHVGRRIAGRPLTPTLDRLAEGAHVFENSYSTSTHTAESLPGVMFGQPAPEWHRGRAFFGVDRSLAEILGQLGYQTLAIQSIPYLDPLTLHGFQEADNSIGQADGGWDRPLGEETTVVALNRVLEGGMRRPFFLWVHYFDPHAFYVPQPELADWLGTQEMDVYRHEVHMADRAIGVLLGNLQHRGLLDNTIVVFLSDHGESFGEHGVHGHLKHAFEEIVRVPLIMQFPGMGAGNHSTRVSGVDVFPTLIDFLGIEGTNPRPGRSLLPAMRGDALPDRPVYVSVDAPGYSLAAVMFDRWKLIEDRGQRAWFLYDLEADPGEHHNLITTQAERFAQGRALLGRHDDTHYNTLHLEAKARVFDARGLALPPVVKGVDPNCFNLSEHHHKCLH